MSKFAIRRERERKCNKEKYSQEIIVIKIYTMERRVIKNINKIRKTEVGRKIS